MRSSTATTAASISAMLWPSTVTASDSGRNRAPPHAEPEPAKVDHREVAQRAADEGRVEDAIEAYRKALSGLRRSFETQIKTASGEFPIIRDEDLAGR